MSMGRISKRHPAGAETLSSGSPGSKAGCFKAGIYARLSADLDERKNESIEVQIEIAKKFVEEWNHSNHDRIEVAGCYTDLGKTGTNFNRDGFKRLMQDVRLGDINCVIVKDLSRFGRNYLEAGNYIEKIFPFLGVRFIAVADGYDTGADGNDTKQMASEIKNLVNDMYAKDFSLKARSSLAQRRKEGAYVGGPAPYGYRTEWEGRLRKLVPDENTADIVRYIYRKFIETESYKAVADDLNTRKINPPTVYRKTGEAYCPLGEDFKGWDKSGVERIIKSDTYSGRLVQGKTSITARNESNRIHKPEDDWVVKEETHEPLIGTETAEESARVRRKLRERTEGHKHPTEGCPIGENIFDKVLYCGVCGRKMTRHSYVKRYEDGIRKRMGGYFCLNGGSTKTDVCPSSNRISNIELTNILFSLFEIEFAENLKKQKNYVETAKEIVRQKKAELERSLRSAAHTKERLDGEESDKYMAYRSGRLSQKEYVAYKMQKEDRVRELEKKETQFREQSYN
ncbi:MAG: recombinase family protein, partial [Lachnospiraceae bacterium]|nr:recombinase family protein [Lachnospiraceae bacterium]